MLGCTLNLGVPHVAYHRLWKIACLKWFQAMCRSRCSPHAFGAPLISLVKGVRGFLGLTGYCRRFIKDYGKIAQPLNQLLKKENISNFLWNDEARNAFLTLQKVVISAPTLTMPGFSKQFLLECDTSRKGLRAVLMQNKHPIAFFSKALSDQSFSKSTYEKKMMALVLVIQQWRPYLVGR